MITSTARAAASIESDLRMQWDGRRRHHSFMLRYVSSTTLWHSSDESIATYARVKQRYPWCVHSRMNTTTLFRTIASGHGFLIWSKLTGNAGAEAKSQTQNAVGISGRLQLSKGSSVKACLLRQSQQQSKTIMDAKVSITRYMGISDSLFFSFFPFLPHPMQSANISTRRTTNLRWELWWIHILI